MSGMAPAGIKVELEALARLLAAGHLRECGGWSEAQNRADEDVSLWRRARGTHQDSIEIVPAALFHLVDAAANALRHCVVERGSWADQVTLDVAVFGQLCRDQSGW